MTEVSNICWEQMVTETDDINKIVNNWSKLFSLSIDEYAPLIGMRVSEKYCPWINKNLKELMRSRDKLKKAASKTQSQLLMDSYRQVRNKVNSMKIQLKKKYFTDKISENQGNMKESWKAVNELLVKRSKTSDIGCLKDSCTEIVQKKDISDAKNTFLCSVGKELADKIDFAPNKE